MRYTNDGLTLQIRHYRLEDYLNEISNINQSKNVFPAIMWAYELIEYNINTPEKSNSRRSFI